MPTDWTTITLSDLVRRATSLADPDGTDPAVVEFQERYEDDDVPVRGVLDSLEERIAFGADEEPGVVMAQAVVLYLARRIDELTDEPGDVLRLAARAEFDGAPPPDVARWLEAAGVELT